MYKAVFIIDKMDCPCEENLIRLKLENLDNIIHQEYDLTNRKLTIIYRLPNPLTWRQYQSPSQ
jgi:hypothetical protein